MQRIRYRALETQENMDGGINKNLVGRNHEIETVSLLWRKEYKN